MQMHFTAKRRTTLGFPFSREFQTIPDELLEQILVAGCQIVYIHDYKDLFVKPGIRRLKLFPKIARSVCRRWYNIIAYQQGRRNTELWIMYAQLELRQRVPAFGIARFKRDMANSQDADLVLRFVAPIPKFRIKKSSGYPPRPDKTMQPDETMEITRIFVHGMYLADLYRNQLAVLDLNVAGNRALGHCLELLFKGPAPRLTTILFSHTGWKLPISTSVLLDSGTVSGFEHLAPKQLEMPRTLKHLISLNTLQLPAVPWLEDLQCSSCIHLILNEIKFDDNPWPFKLVHLSYLEFSGEFPAETEPFDLSGLQQLLIRADVHNTMNFLTKISLPALKIVGIHIKEGLPSKLVPQESYPTSNIFLSVTELDLLVSSDELCLHLPNLFVQSPLLKLRFNSIFLATWQPYAVGKLLKSAYKWELQELTCVFQHLSHMYTLFPNTPSSPDDKHFFRHLLKHASESGIQRLTFHFTNGCRQPHLFWLFGRSNSDSWAWHLDPNMEAGLDPSEGFSFSRNSPS